MIFGKVRIEGVKSIRILSVNVLKFCGMLLNVLYWIFVVVLKLKCMCFCRCINGFFDGIAVRTVRRF